MAQPRRTPGSLSNNLPPTILQAGTPDSAGQATPSAGDRTAATEANRGGLPGVWLSSDAAELPIGAQTTSGVGFSI